MVYGHERGGQDDDVFGGGALALLRRDGGRTEEAEKTAAVGQENFGVGAGVGLFNPNGLVLRGGARAVSLEVSGGFGITLLTYGSNTDPTLELLAPPEVTPQLVFDFLEFRHEVRAGLRAGYRYNAALGNGAPSGDRSANAGVTCCSKDCVASRCIPMPRPSCEATRYRRGTD